jgi:PAS domain S-box-containing protein
MSEKPTYEELEQRVREFEQTVSDRERPEVQYRGIFEASKDTFLIFDMDGVIREVNPAACEMYGYSHDEMIGLTGKDIVHPDYQYLFKEFVKKAAEGRIFSAESVDIRKDGSSFHIEVRGSGLTYNGEPHLLAVVRDITERKRMEEELRAERERFQSLSDNAPFGMVMIAKDGTFKHINPKFYELFGYDLSDIPNGRTWFRKACPDPVYRHKAISTWVEDLASSEVGEKRPREFEVKCKDGSKKIVSFTPVQLETGENLMACEDITDRKQAEEALRKSEEKYRSIFKDSRDAIYITTRNGKFIDANQPALDLFGYSREEMASVNALQIYANPGDAVRFQKDIEKTGFLRDYELTFRKKDGTEIDCLLNTTIRRANDGSILAYQGIVRDMTEQKKLEAQLRQAQKMEAIGVLAGGIAHDFNNILGAIIGYTEIAGLHIGEADKLKHDLTEVLNAAKRARDLISRILAFSRKGEQERIPVQISPIVKEALKMLRSSLPTTIEIRQNIESDTGVVEADPTQIHQILMNLCTNASHSMREEGGILDVEIRNVEVGSWDLKSGYLDMTPGSYLLLTVSDRGEGMTPEVLARIFDPYFTTKEKGVGTGLGLSVVHGIVKSHGGTIRAYSEPGKGTTFHVYLPLIKEAKEPAEDMPSPGVIPTGHERILFIDDEPALVGIGKNILERLGYEVTTRTSSLEALELFRTKPDQFDLVITDMTMPNMTGDKLSREIMQIRPDIPVIICTGYSERIWEEKAKIMGIRAFAMKPLIMADLAKQVRNVLDE